MEKPSRQKRRVETTLKESDERYRLVVDNINDGIYTLDADGRFTFVNKAIERRSGIPFDKFVGLHYLDIVSPKDHKRVKANFEKIMRGEKVPPYELEYITSNGSPLCVEINTQPIHKQGQIVGQQGISRDITERKRAEVALRQAHRALEDRVKERTAQLERINKQLKLELSKRTRAEEDRRKSEEKFKELAEVLQLVSEGKTSKEIASCLCISIKTVNTHRRQIMNKLAVSSIAELTKYAIRSGLTSLDT